jgi:transcriptional regulator with XRE-family HTH domain
MQVQTKPTKLRLLRERYSLTQQQLAVLAGLTFSTYYRAERGDNVSYTTAMAILEALNSVKSERRDDLIALELDDLGLSIV